MGLVPTVGSSGKQCLALHKQRTIESAQEMDVHQVHHDIDDGTELQHKAEMQMLNPPRHHHPQPAQTPSFPLQGKSCMALGTAGML